MLFAVNVQHCAAACYTVLRAVIGCLSVFFHVLRVCKGCYKGWGIVQCVIWVMCSIVLHCVFGGIFVLKCLVVVSRGVKSCLVSMCYIVLHRVTLCYVVFRGVFL